MLFRSDNDLCIIYEKGIKPVKANKFYYFKHPMAREMSSVEISHNDIGEIDRGTWRKYNPYNPFVEDKSEKSVDNLNIESLDDLFDDTDKKSTDKKEVEKAEVKPTVNKPEVKEEGNLGNILDLDFDNESPVLTKEPEEEDTYDLQKELEAKFDELFGPIDES